MTLRTILLTIVALITGAVIGFVLASQWQQGPESQAEMATGDGPCPGGAQPEYWVAPMDDSYRRDEPGKSPMGMELVPECGKATSDAGQIAVSPATIQTLGVRTQTVEKRPLTPEVVAVGRLLADPASERRVHSRAEGWVQDLGVSGDGDRVAAGSELYTLFSPKFYSAESDYLAAQGNAGLRRAAAERLRALGYRQSQIDALKRRGKATDTVAVQASESLTVTGLQVRAGQFVQPGTHLMTLADLERLWLLAEVEEAHIGWLKEGQAAILTMDAYPDRSWRAEVERLASTLDPKTRTLPVRFSVDNPDGALRPEMFGRAEIQLTTDSSVLSVPASSVIRDGRADRVVKALGKGRFQVVGVDLGRRIGGFWEIRGGLKAGDEVVTQGQFLLDTEADVDAEALRMSEPASMDGHSEPAEHAGHSMGREMNGKGRDSDMAHDHHARQDDRADGARP